MFLINAHAQSNVTTLSLEGRSLTAIKVNRLGEISIRNNRVFKWLIVVVLEPWMFNGRVLTLVLEVGWRMKAPGVQVIYANQINARQCFVNQFLCRYINSFINKSSFAWSTPYGIITWWFLARNLYKVMFHIDILISFYTIHITPIILALR